MSAPRPKITMEEFLRAIQEHGTTMREHFVAAGHPPKVVLAKAVGAAKKGYTEFGVAPDRPWLTEKGKAFLAGEIS